MPNKKRKASSKTILCHFWGKYNVKNTFFTLESAHQLLESLQSKKSDHSVKAKLDIFEAGIRVTKKGAFGRRMRVPFVSILRFFVFKSEPHLIFLGTERRKRLYYVVILFRELDQVNELCDLIERKKGGQIRIVNSDETDIVATQSVSVQQMPNFQVTPPEMVHTETQSDPLEEKVVYIQSSEKEPRTPIIRRNIEYHYDERHTDDLGTTRVDALLLRTNMDKNDNSYQWKEDLKYLDYNPDIGTATISEVGPIYMYTAHFTPAEYNNFGTCESDDSDSWSGDSLSSSEHQGVVTKNNDGKTVVMAHRGSDAGVLF